MRITSRANVMARLQLLRRSIDNPSKAPAALQDACSSQGGLAALSLPDFGISPLSLNTMKEAADIEIEGEIGGWAQLDTARVQYLELCDAMSKARSTSVKRSGPTEIAGLRKRLEEAETTRIKMIRAQNDLFKIAQLAAANDPLIRNMVDEFSARWRGIFGIAIKESKEEP